MRVGNKGSPGEAKGRFTRLTTPADVVRPSAYKVPPFDLDSIIQLLGETHGPRISLTLAKQDTRPSINKRRHNGGERAARAVPVFAASKTGVRMPIHQLLAWTLVDGHLTLDREIPSGMTVDLVLNGLKSECRLVRGSCPKDEVLRGV